MAKQDDYTRYTIRIPTDLYERVKEAAGDKSVNAEIIARLEGSFANKGVSPVVVALMESEFNQMIRRLEQRIYNLEHQLPLSQSND